MEESTPERFLRLAKLAKEWREQKSKTPWHTHADSYLSPDQAGGAIVYSRAHSLFTPQLRALTGLFYLLLSSITTNNNKKHVFPSVKP